MKSWGYVREVVSGGALVTLDGQQRRKPMPYPDRLELSMGDKVLVEKIGGEYIILDRYGG